MAINLYDFVEECKEQGLDEYEAMEELNRVIAENQERLVEEYENDPMTWEGWHQQDMIDLRRWEQ